jgi:actin-related protein
MQSVGKLAKPNPDTNEDIIYSPNKYIDSMEIISPIVDGVVVNWDLLEKLWNYSLSNYLKTDMRGLPVLVAEKPFTAPSSRRK